MFGKGIPSGLRRDMAAQRENLKKRAYELTQEAKWEEAVEALEMLDNVFPPDAQVLQGLVKVYHELHDTPGFQDAAERLLKLEPDNPYVMLNLADSYMAQRYPASALKILRRFIAKWPDHEEAAMVHEKISEMEPALDELLRESGLAGKDGFEVRLLHEQAQGLLQKGDYIRARKIYERVLKMYPDFESAQNNLSMMDAVEGKLTTAIERTRRLLKRHPDNVHALSNMVRFLCLSGKLGEAAEWGSKLKAVETDAPEALLKKAEGLAFLGDDQGVLDAFRQSEGVGNKDSKDSKGKKEKVGRIEEPLFYHLAAAASMRLGDDRAARKYWRAALKIEPGFELAEENMADLRKPLGKRNAPWYFSFHYWINARTLQDLAKMMEVMPEDSTLEQATRAFNQFIRKHPEIEGLVPVLLDRSDGDGRAFALQIATVHETPTMLAALKEFALSKRGPDDMRLEAFSAVTEAGLLSSEPVQVWRGGKWEEIMGIGYDIQYEPNDSGHSEQVIDLLSEGTQAIHDKEYDKAERLLKQALELKPGAPDIRNNLALAYERRGRREESAAMIEQIHADHPDYIFATLSLARRYILEGELAKAKALLEPLLARRQFHITEFAAFANAQLEYYEAEDNHEAAWSWLEMWRSVDEDNLAVLGWTLRLGPRRQRRKPRKA